MFYTSNERDSFFCMLIYLILRINIKVKKYVKKIMFMEVFFFYACR